MRNKSPDTKTIAGMKCYSRKIAAQELGMELSTFDELIAKSRARKARVPLKFLQLRKKAPIWVPEKWLLEFVEAVGDMGVAI